MWDISGRTLLISALVLFLAGVATIGALLLGFVPDVSGFILGLWLLLLGSIFAILGRGKGEYYDKHRTRLALSATVLAVLTLVTLLTFATSWWDWWA